VVIGLALVILFLAACGTLQPTPAPTPTEVIDPTRTPQPTPRIIEHPEHTLASDLRIIRTDYVEGDECIRTDGGPNRKCVRARVEQDGVSRMIRTQEELRDLFAPIESAEEALSYAMMATGYEAKYAPEDYRLAVPDNCDPGPQFYHYYTDVLEDTHVTEVINGYHVYLFTVSDMVAGPSRSRRWW
jgi:hypothetical protein